MSSEQDAYHSVCAYTLTRGSAEFMHQHVVDAHAAQGADADTKPIGLTFALVGLYLHVEKGWTGRQVQRAHIRLARRKGPWPPVVLPRDRGSITPLDVLASPEGRERDDAIRAWCESVWEAFADCRPAIVDYLRQHGIV
jgi:Family of unknown function (DUF5946)